MEEYSHDLETNLEDLEMEVETLNAMINELLKRVSKEKDRGLQTLPEVEEWISMAEEIASKASSLLDESISERYKLSKCDDFSQISSSPHSYNDKVRLMLKEVEALRSKGVFKVLVERAPLSRVKKMAPLQKIVSREVLLEKAWKWLNECRTLGLYGMSGVGKSTLLTRIENKFKEVGNFVILAVAVASVEVEGIQEEICKRLDIQWGRETEKKNMAAVISRVLQRYRFVLLLDGIQREGVDLEEIGVPYPRRRNGSKIVFTTSFREVCESHWVDDEVEIPCLSPEEAWDLFQKTVGETTLKSHPDIPHLAKIVARKCGGLPIALNLIGSTMSRKKTVREWHRAIHVLVSSTAEFSGREVPLLKFAYDNLPGEDIKSCFLYCACFPNNRDIRKQDLVDCLIGEGIIADEEDREIAETKGYEMIDDLVRMRFLTENECGYGVKMHDMVLEMALWIASQASDSGRRDENTVVKCGKIIHQLPMTNDWNMVRRMSVTSTQIENISDSHPYTELTTLFLQENANLKGISGEFFRWMTSLVVLNLSSNEELLVLPEEISNLVSLRFLNLSSSGIRRLPLALKKLNKLIHLDLDNTGYLEDIDVIASLLNLQVLRLFWSVTVDLGLMEDIHLLKSLKELSLTVDEDAVLQQLQSNHRLASCIRRLRLGRITITEGGILTLNSGIRELDIYDCDIIDWRSTIQREAVHSGNIEKTPQFRNIRRVSLNWCKCLRDMTWLLFAPSLEDLTLFHCPEMEEVISKEKAMPQLGHTSEHPFQNLTRLTLYALPKLESIYWTPLPFPVLEYLCIRSCPNLKRLPINSESAKGNHVKLELDEEWIKGVEWEDEATKQRVSDLNIPRRHWF